jgi:hypothetical protein
MATSRRIRAKGAAVAAMMVVLMAGCGDEQRGADEDLPEPTTYAVVEDAAAFDATRTEVTDVFRDASEVANEALGGEGLRGRRQVGDTLCNEVYPRRFSRLEGGTTLRAPGDSIATGLETVKTAWEQRGWTVEVADDGTSALLVAKTSTDVPFTVQVRLQVNQTDPVTLGAGLSLSTRCLKLPQDVADTL